MADDDVPFNPGGVMRAYRDHVISVLGYQLPAVTSGTQLIELAKRTAGPALEAEHGLSTQPPYPGAAEVPEEMPTGWRLICACRLYHNGTERGVLFTTFVSGRKTTVVFNGPGTVIPDEYKPLSSR
jgi:hypothetical protein